VDLVAVKEAWDNLDSGLKQWLIQGVSLAISFIPIVGPLISCVIDGTFTDMWEAIKSGDWGALALCAMAFVPGLKQAKAGLKVFGKAGITANRAAGKAFEKSVIKKLNLENAGARLKKTGNMKTYRVADAFDKEKNLVEIKHVKQLKITGQTRDQLEWARATGNKVFFAYDQGYTTNADVFAERLAEYGGLFEMLPVIP